MHLYLMTDLRFLNTPCNQEHAGRGLPFSYYHEKRKQKLRTIENVHLSVLEKCFLKDFNFFIFYVIVKSLNLCISCSTTGEDREVQQRRVEPHL